MAVDMFLKLDEIKGESADSKHKDEIDVLAWSWGLSQSGTMHMSTGGGAGKANFQDISITKYVDQSSNLIKLFCANGDHFKEAILTVRKAGKVPLEYIVYKFKDCLVTSVSTGGSGGEEVLTENITLNFAQVMFAYKKQKPDGTGDTAKEFKWDIPKNEAM